MSSKGSSSTISSLSTSTTGTRERRVSKVRSSRLLFIGFLSTVAGLLSYTAYRLLTGSERRLAEEQYEAIIDRALDTALEITLRKRLGAKSVASVTSFAFPDAEVWPNVNLYGFEHLSRSILDTAGDTNTGVCALVRPEQLSEFEDFAYNVAFPHNKYPNDTAGITAEFNRGVTGFRPDPDTGGWIRYLERDMNGTTYWNSPYKISCPFIMHSANERVLMFDLHSMESRGKVIDEVIACAADRERNVTESGSYVHDPFLNDCAFISDMTVMYSDQQEIIGQSAFIMQPIYPANDKNVLSGIVLSSLKWKEVFDSLFSNTVSGIDIVLETETQVYTYHESGGTTFVKGVGDLHEPKYSKYGRSIPLYSPGLFSYASAPYKLTLYPSDEYFEVYSTDNPVVATIGSLLIIIFTSFLFFLYDFFVRQEFHQKKEIMEAKRLFVRFISHEVRTPLNTICMGSELVQEEMSRFSRSQREESTSTDQDRKMAEKLSDWSDLVREILTNAGSAVNVLSDLLNYDKVETGTLSLDLTIIPIWSLIKRTASEFRLAASAKKINYAVDFAEASDDKNDSEIGKGTLINLPDGAREQKVVGDTMRITQVFRNFLSNAVKFTPESGDITVRISWEQLVTKAGSETRKEFVLENGEDVCFLHSGYVRVDVKDSGAGLSHDQLSKLFGEGVQFNVSELQAGKGSGLGLYITKGIVEQHGGSLKATSKGLGQGTTFTVTLPLYHVPEESLPDSMKRRRHLFADFREGNGKEASSSSNDPLEAYRILVVDDTAINRKLLMRLLQNKGHSCDEAENGLAAVELVMNAMKEDRRYDTILLDYEMPIMKGPETANKMREIGCDSFIVGVTGNLLPEDVEHFKQQGANCVFAKPLNLRDLEEAWVSHGV